jgi:uncharacterized protein
MDSTDFLEIYKKQEELLPELKPYLSKTGSFFDLCLKHPLVFGIPYTPQFNAFYNEQYRKKKEYLDELEKKGKWDSSIFLYERPYRWEVLWEIHENLTDEEYWEILAGVYSDTENLWQYKLYVEILLASKRPHREKFMEKDELEWYNRLPEEFVIYRGFSHKKGRLSLSWTLSYMKACWFANRFQRNGRVVKAKIKKEDVIGVLLGRSEAEIVVNSSKLIEPKLVRTTKRPGWLEMLYQEACGTYKLSGLHGPWHWEQVERNAIALCTLMPKADKNVCRAFALIHDCKRENDDDDPGHGKRSAELVKNLYSKNFAQLKQVFTKDQLEMLIYACHYHNIGQVSDIETIGVCWDADRLDLARVSIYPDTKYLSTKPSHNLIFQT